MIKRSIMEAKNWKGKRNKESVTMSKAFEKLMEPGEIGKVKVRNRIVASPVCTSFFEGRGGGDR